MLTMELDKIFNNLRIALEVILCFLVTITLIIICLIPIPFILIWRQIIAAIFVVFHNEKYKLVTTEGSFYTAWNSPENVLNIGFLLYLDGHCNIEKIRERIKEYILRKDTNGLRPNGTFLNAFFEKYQFLCVSDKSSTIDFTHHVRLFPGSEDIDKRYSEKEFLADVAKSLDEGWLEMKPRWEILITPNVIVEDDGKLRTVLFLKFHHFYADGISLMQFIRNGIADQPGPSLPFDPVNRPNSKVPLVLRVLTAIQSFVMEPYIIFKLLRNTANTFLLEDRIAPKLLGMSKMRISTETVRQIRKHFNCSTEAVYHSAFFGSLQKTAARKGIKVPPNTLAASVRPILPYEDEFPRNRVYFGYQMLESELHDPVERLDKMNTFLRRLVQRHNALKLMLIGNRLSGFFPMWVTRFVMKFLKLSYYVSNVPGYQELLKVHGVVVSETRGFAPISETIGVSMAAGYYNELLFVGITAKQSPLICNQDDMEILVSDFEMEINHLEQLID
ncbi:unnamed protein product [Orchesella dallaii]|uniref:O-acyltransferase WSD1 C-terminal domain-containing protein n=1 Tax=Orchesella dallaii TaxID=48710 RepID=A0ABP1RVK6_9HEXA